MTIIFNFNQFIPYTRSLENFKSKIINGKTQQ